MNRTSYTLRICVHTRMYKYTINFQYIRIFFIRFRNEIDAICLKKIKAVVCTGLEVMYGERERGSVKKK